MLNFTRLSNVYVEEGRGNEGSPFSFPQLLSSLSDSSVHGIPQARILEWVAISFSRGSPLPMAWTPVSSISGIFFTIWSTRQAHQIKWWRFITTGHEQKNRGKIEASQVSRTKPEQKPGTEKGQRWCNLREIPRMGRAPSRHRLELSNVRNPPHNQSHFPSGKDGVFFILWVLPGAQFSHLWKAGGARKDVPGKAAKRKQRKPRRDAGDQASWEYLGRYLEKYSWKREAGKCGETVPPFVSPSHLLILSFVSNLGKWSTLAYVESDGTTWTD